MADTQTQEVQGNDEAQALAAAQAGYDKTATRSPELPVTDPVAASPAAQPLTEPDTSASLVPDESDLEVDPAITELEAPDPIAAVSEQLAALRSQVSELAAQGGAASEVRKLHGEIGNINRTLKQLQAAQAAPAANAPAAEDEVAAALTQAEDVAKEFPEIAGPLVKAIKALQAKTAVAAAPVQVPEPDPEIPGQEENNEVVEQPVVDVEALSRQAAIKAIDEVHPDRHQINASPAFKAWFASKTPEYQQRVTTTWNPAVLSQCYSEFKASLKARQRRQERLDAATLPQGNGGSAGPTALPDEQGYWNGYNKKPRQL